MAADDARHGRGERGTYGLRVSGLHGVDQLLVHANPAWPRLEIGVRRGLVGTSREHVGDDHAVLVLLGADVVVNRSPGRAVFTFEHEPRPEALVHPYLAPIAGLFSYWHRRESLHAGAFVADGGAWGVLAEREGGKSTTLARLALDGIEIVTDDLLVLEGETVFAGPRAIDLRCEPAQVLGIGEPLGVLGRRERWRLTLEPSEGSFPLRGWVFLEWGEEIAVTQMSSGSRLQRLAAERTLRLIPRDPRALLELASLPALELRRPRGWRSLDETVRVLLDSLP